MATENVKLVENGKTQHLETNTEQVFDFAKGKWLNEVIDEVTKEFTDHKKASTTEISNLKSSVNDGKNSVKNAIIGKGGTVLGGNTTPTFAQLADGVAELDSIPFGYFTSPATEDNFFTHTYNMRKLIAPNHYLHYDAGTSTFRNLYKINLSKGIGSSQLLGAVSYTAGSNDSQFYDDSNKKLLFGYSDKLNFMAISNGATNSISLGTNRKLLNVYYTNNIYYAVTLDTSTNIVYMQHYNSNLVHIATYSLTGYQGFTTVIMTPTHVIFAAKNVNTIVVYNLSFVLVKTIVCDGYVTAVKTLDGIISNGEHALQASFLSNNAGRIMKVKFKI